MGMLRNAWSKMAVILSDFVPDDLKRESRHSNNFLEKERRHEDGTNQNLS